MRSHESSEHALCGRSRNAGHPALPEQIRIFATNAYDSYLELAH
jgi:hypothetical protein